MHEVFFDRAVRGEPARVLKQLERWFTTNGYTVSVRSSLEFQFVGESTSGRHRLTVRADGMNVRFGFVPGAPGVTLPQRSELERRVDAALQDFGSPPPAAKAASPSGRRCSICATELAGGDRNCPMCGMTQP